VLAEPTSEASTRRWHLPAFAATARLQWPPRPQALREAFARGKRTGFLPTFRWEEHWAMPVTELRALLACPPAEVFRAAA
jgi:hypothetical protein